MTKLSNSEIKKLLLPYGVSASDVLCDQVQIYMSLLLEWNRRVSLTTVTDPVEIVKFHFGESMFAASSVPIRNGRLADVGSGPGFPAIPLSMVNKDFRSLRLSRIPRNLRSWPKSLADCTCALLLLSVAVWKISDSAKRILTGSPRAPSECIRIL